MHPNISKSRLWRKTGLVFTAVACACLPFVAIGEEVFLNRKQVPAYSAPSENSVKVFDLEASTKLRKEDELGNWIAVSAPNLDENEIVWISKKFVSGDPKKAQPESSKPSTIQRKSESSDSEDSIPWWMWLIGFVFLLGFFGGPKKK